MRFFCVSVRKNWLSGIAPYDVKQPSLIAKRDPKIKNLRIFSFKSHHQKRLRILTGKTIISPQLRRKIFEQFDIQLIQRFYGFTSGFLHWKFVKKKFWFPLSTKCLRIEASLVKKEDVCMRSSLSFHIKANVRRGIVTKDNCSWRKNCNQKISPEFDRCNEHYKLNLTRRLNYFNSNMANEKSRRAVLQKYYNKKVKLIKRKCLKWK